MEIFSDELRIKENQGCTEHTHDTVRHQYQPESSTSCVYKSQSLCVKTTYFKVYILDYLILSEGHWVSRSNDNGFGSA